MAAAPPWRFLEGGAAAGAHSGAYNMAVDEAVLAEVEAGRSPPTVRVYGWQPACVSLGHSQRPGAELDLRRVRERGFDVVMRVTGGRAVLHAGELTYSVIAPFAAAGWCVSRSLSYEAISGALVAALAGQGFATALDKGYPLERPAELRAMTPCFSSTARSEVTWSDKKVVGSAQRRYRNAFLQHGSILVSEAHRKLVDVLPLDAEKRGAYLDILDRNAVSLERIAGRPLDWRDLARDFLPRFASALDLPYSVSELTARESALARLLEADKLRFQERLWGGVPAVAREDAVHA